MSPQLCLAYHTSFWETCSTGTARYLLPFIISARQITLRVSDMLDRI